MVFEPRIVAFLCNWCAYSGADLAGVSRLQYPPNMIPIRVMCSGRVDPQFVLEAFRNGADGVFIGGCHTPGDCHYVVGNFKAFKRVVMLKKMLEQLGIEPERLRIEWVSASEGRKFAEVSKEFVEQVRALGPLNYGKREKA
ncbi:MAG: hydrogenase iron-sulfur subunit [Thermoplasmata archaeon]